uniref:RNA-binding protein 25 n=1 Tax=Schistocephalus solidus TaxID=70667 RepID=A0A0X3NVL8_SCHSO
MSLARTSAPINPGYPVMNPYGGQYFGLPQAYYSAVPTAYPHFVPAVVGYTQVAIPPPPVTTAQTTTVTPTTTTVSTTETVAPTPQEKTPVTTVFVGNIPERAPDSLIKSLLMRCGNILSWKRVQGASGKLQAFGFCEYQDPESTMRCVRLLNEFEIIDKKLLVKVDPKTEDLLAEYKKKKQKEGDDGSLGSTAAEVDEATKQDDEVVKTALQNILQESVSAFQLGHESPNRQDYLEGPRHLTLDDMDLDVDRKDLINKEIETFRRRNEKETPTEERTRRPKDTDRDYYSSRYSRSRAERELARTRHSRSRSSSREPSKKRLRGSVTSSHLTSSTHSRSSHIDEEEEAIKKRLERKLREKEESYQERLRQWESRERKKLAEYEREKERERKKQEELNAEAQSLHEFFEDYDDDLEDPKFYKGSALQGRLADREVEEAADERDRQKEIEQLEAAKRKLIEERDPNAESIILQMEQKMQEHLRKSLNLDGGSISGTHYPTFPRSSPLHNVDGNDESSQHADTPPSAFIETSKDTTNPAADSSFQNDKTDSSFKPVSPDQSRILDQPNLPNNAKNTDGQEISRKDSGPFLFSMASTEHTVRKPAAAFTDDDFEQRAAKPTLSWLPPSATSSQKPLPPPPEEPHVSRLSTAEKKAVIKRIIEQIPTAKEDLFAYPIDWAIVDSVSFCFLFNPKFCCPNWFVGSRRRVRYSLYG